MYEKREDIFFYKLNREFPDFKKCKDEKNSNIRIYVKLYRLSEYFKDVKDLDIYGIYNLHCVEKVIHKDFIDIMEENISLCIKMRGAEMRAYCIHLSFRWIAKNIDFLEKYENFKHSAQQKIKELKNEPLAEKTIKEFGYLEFL
jgi:hypothetical protein